MTTVVLGALQTLVRDTSLHAWLEEQAMADSPHLEGDFVPEEISMLVDYLMKELPAHSYRVLAFRYGLATGKKMSVAQIANVLSVTPAEVNTIINEAKASMHDKLLQTMHWLDQPTDELPQPRLPN